MTGSMRKEFVASLAEAGSITDVRDVDTSVTLLGAAGDWDVTSEL